MKKVITYLCLIGSFVIILTSLKAGTALAFFLLAGIVPGTDIIVTPEQTFILVGLIAGFALSRLTVPQLKRFFSRPTTR